FIVGISIQIQSAILSNILIYNQ
ncbi:uncharacterized protein METZ01_LOCUS203192, partial [marine metagenome]